MRKTNKNFQEEGLSHELFLTARQKTKIRNAFADNMSTDVKLSKAQLSKIIQSVIFCDKTSGIMIGNLSKKAFLDISVPLAEDFFA